MHEGKKCILWLGVNTVRSSHKDKKTVELTSFLSQSAKGLRSANPNFTSSSRAKVCFSISTNIMRPGLRRPYKNIPLQNYRHENGK